MGEDIKKIKYISKWRKFTNWIIGPAILIIASTTLLILTKDSEEEIAVSIPQSKNIPSKEITGDRKPIYIEEELPINKKKNLPTSISSLKETEDDKLKSKEPSEVKERILPETADGQYTRNQGSNVSPIATDSNDKKNTKPAPSEVKNNCNKDFDIRTESSCKHQENGSVIILADGGKEFTFQVDQLIDNGPKGVFYNLSPGEHKVLVTYNKACTFTRTIKIEEKWCPLNQPFSFNPDYNEKWEIGYEEGAQGKFIIYDRSGKEVYKNTFGSGNEHWNGTDMNGNVVPIGVYAAILYYSDGRKEKVDLTIVR